MSATGVDRATQLLNLMSAGDERAREELLPLIYDEMSALARAHMARERPDHSLDASDLLHEAWIRLFRSDGRTWETRNHFFAMASRVMRNLLVDHARRNRLKKGGGERFRLSLEGRPLSPFDVVDLHEALQVLREVDPELESIVELRCFGGLPAKEVAEVLGTSLRTVERRWPVATAWLRERLNG